MFWRAITTNYQTTDSTETQPQLMCRLRIISRLLSGYAHIQDRLTYGPLTWTTDIGSPSCGSDDSIQHTLRQCLGLRSMIRDFQQCMRWRTRQSLSRYSLEKTNKYFVKRQIAKKSPPLLLQSSLLVHDDGLRRWLHLNVYCIQTTLLEAHQYCTLETCSLPSQHSMYFLPAPSISSLKA